MTQKRTSLEKHSNKAQMIYLKNKGSIKRQIEYKTKLIGKSSREMTSKLNKLKKKQMSAGSLRLNKLCINCLKMIMRVVIKNLKRVLRKITMNLKKTWKKGNKKWKNTKQKWTKKLRLMQRSLSIKQVTQKRKTTKEMGVFVRSTQTL
jgi:hypothetical protein